MTAAAASLGSQERARATAFCGGSEFLVEVAPRGTDAEPALGIAAASMQQAGIGGMVRISSPLQLSSSPLWCCIGFEPGNARFHHAVIHGLDKEDVHSSLFGACRMTGPSFTVSA